MRAKQGWTRRFPGATPASIKLLAEKAGRLAGWGKETQRGKGKSACPENQWEKGEGGFREKQWGKEECGNPAYRCMAEKAVLTLKKHSNGWR